MQMSGTFTEKGRTILTPDLSTSWGSTFQCMVFSPLALVVEAFLATSFIRNGGLSWQKLKFIFSPQVAKTNTGSTTRSITEGICASTSVRVSVSAHPSSSTSTSATSSSSHTGFGSSLLTIGGGEHGDDDQQTKYKHLSNNR